MSRIEDLISQLAPSGVATKALGDVVVNLDSRRRPVTRSDRQAGPYPYYGANGIQDYVADYIFEGTFLLMGEDGSVMGRNGSPILNWATGRIWVNNHAHVLVAKSDDLDLRFLFHYLHTVNISAYVTGGAQPKLNQGNLNRILVPVPPVEVQREIVRLLDQFQLLEAELEAELEARGRQYSYYRRALLTPNEPTSTRSTPIGDAILLRAGKFISASEIVGDRDNTHPFPCFGGNGVRGYVKQSNHDGAYVLIGRQGAWSGNVKRVSGRFYATEHAVVAHPIQPLDTSWLFHQLTVMNLGQYVSHGAQPGLAVSKLNAVRMAIPAFDEQVRIGGILDKFDALVNDASIGLPAELRARRQQYEYYRGKLLTFPEAAA